LSDASISLIPTYGPWIIFGIVALKSAGAPLPGETILVAVRPRLAQRRTEIKAFADHGASYQSSSRCADRDSLGANSDRKDQADA
jgi:hypothetical protein